MKIRSVLIGVGVAIAIFLFLPFHLFNGKGVKGSGNIIKENRQTESFHGVDIGSAFHVFLKKGPKQSIIIETDDNLQALIKLKVEDGILDVETKKSIINPKVMNIYLVSPQIDNIELSGACKMESDDRYEMKKMKLDLSGASELYFHLKAKKLNMEVSGAAKVVLDGYAEDIDVDASGASHIKLGELEVKTALVDISGASNINLNVTESIKGECSGASHLSYGGGSAFVEVETSGAASISKE